jgi:hypothetical protein
MLSPDRSHYGLLVSNNVIGISSKYLWYSSFEKIEELFLIFCHLNFGINHIFYSQFLSSCPIPVWEDQVYYPFIDSRTFCIILRVIPKQAWNYQKHSTCQILARN